MLGGPLKALPPLDKIRGAAPGNRPPKGTHASHTYIVFDFNNIGLEDRFSHNAQTLKNRFA